MYLSVYVVLLCVYFSSYSERDGEAEGDGLTDKLGVLLIEAEGDKLVDKDGDGLTDKLKERDGERLTDKLGEAPS